MAGVPSIVVVGAGIAGLAAATTLGASDGPNRARVRVVEAEPVAGGRMASVRMGDAVFDHGAQFFTTRSDEFAAVVADATKAGAVQKWCDGFDDPPDGYPRYRGSTSMADLVRYLAREVDVTYGVTVEDLGEFPADAYILTAPVGCSLSLLATSGIGVPDDMAIELGELEYKKTIAVLLTLDSPPSMADHGGRQYDQGNSLAFVTDNHRKGISPTPALTVHLSNELSAELWETPDADVVDRARRLVSIIVDGCAVTGSLVHRWSAAGPVRTHPERAVSFGGQPLVVLAGEIFGGPKVEGAFLSGVAAGRAVLDHL